MYNQALEAKDYIQTKITTKPRTAIVLGSGLTSIMDELRDKVEILYEEIPHFKTSTVKGHTSKLVAGTLNGKDVLLMSDVFTFMKDTQ